MNPSLSSDAITDLFAIDSGVDAVVSVEAIGMSGGPKTTTYNLADGRKMEVRDSDQKVLSIVRDPVTCPMAGGSLHVPKAVFDAMKEGVEYGFDHHTPHVARKRGEELIVRKLETFDPLPQYRI